MNLEKSKIEFLQKNHREPATEELASICGMSIEKISNIMTAKERTISLDASIATESGSHSLLSILESNAEGIKLQDQQTHTKEICDKLLSTLSDQEQDILRAKF
ncbi:MAG: hypothetical protein H6766_07995 [Candidatus Peribacteria bacterium]|nr:MAG: hypothetical protein H6766_07995 [Candidatus Peribacteria bacterium]